MKKAQRRPAPITRRSPVTAPWLKDEKTRLVVINSTPKRLAVTPNIFLLPKCSFSKIGLMRATQTALRFMKSDDLEAVVKTMPMYCKRYAKPFATPKNRIRRFLLKLKLKFFVSNETETIISEATRNLKKA